MNSITAFEQKRYSNFHSCHVFRKGELAAYKNMLLKHFTSVETRWIGNKKRYIGCYYINGTTHRSTGCTFATEAQAIQWALAKLQTTIQPKPQEATHAEA